MLICNPVASPASFIRLRLVCYLFHPLATQCYMRIWDCYLVPVNWCYQPPIPDVSLLAWVRDERSLPSLMCHYSLGYEMNVVSNIKSPRLAMTFVLSQSPNSPLTLTTKCEVVQIFCCIGTSLNQIRNVGNAKCKKKIPLAYFALLCWSSHLGNSAVRNLHPSRSALKSV